MTERGNLLLLLLLRLRWAFCGLSGLVGVQAFEGRRVSYWCCCGSVARWAPALPALPVLPRKGLMRRPMLKDSRRGCEDWLAGRREEVSSTASEPPPAPMSSEGTPHVRT